MKKPKIKTTVGGKEIKGIVPLKFPVKKKKHIQTDDEIEEGFFNRETGTES